LLYSISILSTDELNVSNLARLLTLLHEAENDWFGLGLQLGVEVQALERIKQEHSTVKERFTTMLTEWLRMLNVSWEKLLEALIQPTVRHHSLALKGVREQGVFLPGIV